MSELPEADLQAALSSLSRLLENPVGRRIFGRLVGEPRTNGLARALERAGIELAEHPGFLAASNALMDAADAAWDR